MAGRVPWLEVNVRITLERLVVLCGVIAFIFWGRDGANPDVRDLDLVCHAVSPDKNAFTYFASATNHLCLPADHRVVSDYLSGKPADDTLIQNIIASNAGARGFIQRGLACKTCVWPSQGDADMPVTCITEWVRLANLLAITGRHGRLAGKTDEATRACIELIEFGNMTQANARGLIMYLVGIGLLEKGLTQARELARDPGISAENVRLLLQALDNKSGAVAQGLVHAAKGEYEFGAGTVDRLRAGRFRLPAQNEAARGSLFGLKIRPFYFFQPNKTKGLLAACYREVIADATRCYAGMRWPDLDAIDAFGKNPGWNAFCPNPIGRIFCVALVPASRSVLERKCRTQCSVDATRLILAANLFRRREGHWPTGLADLVPDYLAAIPGDAYDGQPFRCVPSRNVIYSIGPDLKDSGGSKASPAYVDGAGWIKNRCNTEDLVWELGGP